MNADEVRKLRPDLSDERYAELFPHNPGAHMSNKVEAATGDNTPNTFTDSDGDTFEAVQDQWGTINLNLTFEGSANVDERMSFYKADATKIIALIAEAAK